MRHLVCVIVGFKIVDVNRTNTSSTTLLYKIIDKYSQNDEAVHTVATSNSIVKDRFGQITLLDITTGNFTSLLDMDTDLLPLITLVQASHLHTF